MKLRDAFKQVAAEQGCTDQKFLDDVMARFASLVGPTYLDEDVDIESVRSSNKRMAVLYQLCPEAARDVKDRSLAKIEKRHKAN